MIQIYVFIHIFHQRATRLMDRSIREKRKNQEIKYVFQFALCTVCCITTWVSFRVFSYMEVPNGPTYIIPTTFQLLHSATNSIVFLIFNKDVQRKFKLHILGLYMRDSWTNTASPTGTNNRSPKKCQFTKYEYSQIEASENYS